jgi:hypothetical protein
VENITITISCCEQTGLLVARWDDPQGRGGLTTQAERLSDLETNIRDAVKVHFEPSTNEVRVAVPDHKTIAPGTLESILKQAGLAVEDLAEKP